MRDPTRFKGLFTQADPKDIPPGFMVTQRNFGNFRPGRLDVRGGLHPLSNILSNISVYNSNERLIGLFGFAAPHSRWLIGHHTDTAIIAQRNTASSNSVELVPTTVNYDDQHPICFVRDAIGGLLFFNGLERGYRWDGIFLNTLSGGAAQLAGVSSPEDIAAVASSPPTIANNTAITGPTASGEYVMAYRYRDFWGNVSNLSEVREHTAHASGYGFTWSALVSSTQANGSSAQYRAQYIELFRSSAGAPNTLYLLQRIGNNGNIVSVTGNGTTTTMTLPANHGLIVGAVIAITGVTGLTALTIATVAATSATGLSAYNSTDSNGGDWTLTGYTLDNATDEVLEARNIDDTLNVLNEDGTVNARAYGLPPDDKPFVAIYQDVMFAYGRVHYSIGTASAPGGTAVVTLSATAQPKSEWVGRKFIRKTNSVQYTITAVNESTRELTMDRIVAVFSASEYVVTPEATRANLLCHSRPGNVEGFLETDAIRIQQPSDATDLETGLLQFGPYLYAFHEYHTYQITFNTDPRYDGQATLVSYRGAVNNRAFGLDHGAAYIFDQKGGYRIDGPCCPQDITTPVIKNFFNETIDWTEAKKKWYFVSVDPLDRVVRFHCNYTGDSATYPQRALCYSTQTGEWWDEEYPFEICGSNEFDVNGTLRLILGGPGDKYLVMGIRGTGDGLQTPVAGTVSTWVDPTLTATASVFTSAMTGAPLRVVTGTGAGGYATVTYVSGTEVTLSSLSGGFTLSTDSVFVVGAIAAELKTGMLSLLPPKTEDGKPVPVSVKREVRVGVEPTTNDNRLALSMFLNHDSTAVTSQRNQEDRGVKWTSGSANAVFSSKKSQTPRGEDPGVKIVPFDTSMADHSIADRYVSVALSAVQGVNALSLRALDIEGVD